MLLSVGDKLGHYEILSLLGQDGIPPRHGAEDTRN
jgi:hypothetical protein